MLKGNNVGGNLYYSIINNLSIDVTDKHISLPGVNTPQKPNLNLTRDKNAAILQAPVRISQ